MLSVKAVYDGERLKFDEKIEVHTPHDVIVTFLDDPNDDVNGSFMQKAAMEGGAFNFLDSKDEDIYSDADLKVKY